MCPRVEASKIGDTWRFFAALANGVCPAEDQLTAAHATLGVLGPGAQVIAIEMMRDHFVKVIHEKMRMDDSHGVNLGYISATSRLSLRKSHSSNTTCSRPSLLRQPDSKPSTAVAVPTTTCEPRAWSELA